MKVSLKNVGIVNNCSVEFTPGINIIVGSSGSGKSTLLRSIYNMASNEFSDSDISFGSNSMNISIECNGNNIEYVRSLKSKNERFYYIVNGEVYTKVGRSALPAVSEALKIGDIDINGESINFNFNLQFSSPFLILGNQSTLYNVLTYRSSFDISSINDYYTADVKSNASELSSNLKLKEQLESNLDSLENQSKKISCIEQIYSDFIWCKHLSDIIDSLNELKSKILQRNLVNNNIGVLCKAIAHSDTSCGTISNIIELKKYVSIKMHYDETVVSVKNLDKLIKSHVKAIDRLQILLDVSQALDVIKTISKIESNILNINESITSSENLLKKESFLCDLLNYKQKKKSYNKCSKIISAVELLNKDSICIIDDMLLAKDKLYAIESINSKIYSVSEETNIISSKLNEFKYCPLCGGHIHNDN